MRSILFTIIFLSITCAAWTKEKVNAGNDVSISAGDIVYLNGQAHPAHQYIWKSSGTGSFANANRLKTTYTPSQEDIRNGWVKLILMNKRNPRKSDYLVVTIANCNSVDFPVSSDTICGHDNGVAYVVSPAVSGNDYHIQWTSTGTGYFHEENAVTTVYEASAGDTGSGSVLLRITVYDTTGSCPVVSDSLLLKLNDPARINLPDETYAICGDEPFYVEADISGTATTVTWTSSGTGTFSENPSRSTSYQPSAQDRINGYFTLYGTTNDPSGPCLASSDELSVNTYGGAVDAGDDQRVCYTPEGFLSLNATSNSSAITWTSNGTGYFDDPYSLSTNYFYSEDDAALGTVQLQATIDDGACTPFVDALTITFELCEGISSDTQVVHPNPTTNRLTFKYRPSDRISITDWAGREVEFTRWDDRTLDVSRLKPGVYFVQTVNSHGIRQTIRFMKQ